MTYIFKTRRATRLKFCIRNAFIIVLTHAEFHVNRLMLTLIFGIRASEPSFFITFGSQIKYDFFLKVEEAEL